MKKDVKFLATLVYLDLKDMYEDDPDFEGLKNLSTKSELIGFLDKRGFDEIEDYLLGLLIENWND